MTRRLIAPIVLTSVLLSAVLSLSAASPAVSNRAPVSGEIGYLPRDGATVVTNPPAFAWLAEPGAEGYAVQFARDGGFTHDLINIPRTPYVLYTHTGTMAPGAWWWRYACLDGKSNRSAWSKVRKFTIAPDAQPFPRPGEELIRRRLPNKHPRLMLRPEELPVFQRARNETHKERWSRLLQDAEDFLEMSLIPEPPPWTGGKWNAEEWRRNFQQAIRAATAAETLAFCYLLSGDSRYGEGARKWLLHIADWDPAGTTSMDINDEAGMPILYLTSRAYDWAYDALSETDREKLRAMVRARGEEAYHWLHDQPHEQKAYNSHAGRMWHFLGEAAIAYYGEVPEAKKWLEYALTIFWGWYPAYGDADGGWAQGYSYWGSYVNRSTWWLDALQAALKINGTEKPFYRHVGDFPLYVAPPGGALTGFGDFAERRPSPRRAAVVAYFARMRGHPQWQWYAEAWGQRDSSQGPIGFLRNARPTPPIPKAKAPADWPTAKLFRRAGWVSLHSNLLDGANSVQVMLRAAPLGNISHSHADQNGIVVGAYGSPLLVNTGVRPWYGSPFCKQWYWTTKAHNALEIDGKGQPKTWQGTGKVVVFQPGRNHDYVVGDATPSYEGRVERYRRHLVFLKPDIVVLLDEVKAEQPVSLKFWLHGHTPFTIDQGSGRVGLTYENAALTGFLLAPGGLRIDQTDKYPIPPEMGKTEPEWHLWAETDQKRSAARVLAVFGISRAGDTVDLKDVEDVSRGQKITVRFRHSGKLSKISFDFEVLTVTVD